MEEFRDTLARSPFGRRPLSILTGLLMIAGNGYWLGSNVHTFYIQNFTSVFIIVMMPNWILILSALIAAAGIFLGIMVFINRLKPFKWFLIDLGLIGINIGLHIMATSHGWFM